MKEGVQIIQKFCDASCTCPLKTSFRQNKEYFPVCNPVGPPCRAAIQLPPPAILGDPQRRCSFLGSVGLPGKGPLRPQPRHVRRVPRRQLHLRPGRLRQRRHGHRARLTTSEAGPLPGRRREGLAAAAESGTLFSATAVVRFILLFKCVLGTCRAFF